MIIKRCISLFVLCFWLSACSTQAPLVPQKYLLPKSPLVAAMPGGADLGRAILLEDIELSEHLRQAPILLIENSGEVYEASSHFWAEPLSEQMLSLTLDRLQQRFPETTLLLSGERVEPMWRLSIRVDRFQSSRAGEITLSGRWLLWDDRGQLLTVKAFTNQRDQVEDGYTAMVQALSASWLELVDDIARQLPVVVSSQER